ncbi:hypothetical protein GGH92_004225 [Coemansia sp. RSA 2673]|nr:hypothetical protein GGI14_002620 [Coemansia sp. S680]KAJ2033968.1 hypothetical protein H4S03_005293 [Coemansia sp. S3946]KAJ2345027.1 hypothetical protein GGH92_004225 [Coemansia sp. RSA 2673]
MADNAITTADQVSELVNAPMKVIDRLFDNYKAATTTDGGPNSREFNQTVQDHFQGLLSKPGAFELIPVFGHPGSHATKNKSGSLVRFRCMVQDPSYGEELHLSVAQLVNSATGETKQVFSHYTDADHVIEDGWEVDYGSPSNVFTERDVAYCVSIPGQNEWAQLGSFAVVLESALESLNIGEQSSGDLLLVDEKKYPLRGCEHLAALVKFHSPGRAPPVASTVDVVGIYELGHSPKEQGGSDANAQGRWPCIHAIFSCDITVDTLVPDLPRPVAGEHIGRRNMTLAHLGVVLGGDDLAAHYLLLHLLSKTVAVQDVKVGKFSLNLVGFPLSSKDQTSAGTFALSSPSTRWVSGMLAQLVPRCVEIPFELKTVNSSTFLPNAESGDLQAGVLQLAADTEIICDETCLHEGTLDERGLRNLQALQSVILDQTVTYVYPFQPINMATNLRVLVFSNGKSILENDCDLYLSESAAAFLASIHDESAASFMPLDPMHTEQIRQYLELARHMEFSVPTEVSNAISDEYAALRREAHEKGEKMMTQAELSLIVTVARLISISKGEAELSSASWKEAMELETRRSERNALAKAARPATSADPSK